MVFYEYQNCNATFLKVHEKYLRNYPYAFCILEKYLRTKAYLQDDRWANDLIYLYSRSSLLKLAYRSYILFFYYFGFQKILFRRDSCYVFNIDRFPNLDRRITCNTKISLLKKPKSWYEYFSLLHLDLYALLSSSSGIINLYKKLRNNSISDLLLDESLLALLNQKVQSEVALIAKILYTYKIKNVLTSSDDDPYMRILCKAAIVARTDVNIIAHGYLGNPKLLTVAPIYASKLFVWTSKQRVDLCECLDEPDKSKVYFAGSPLVPEKHVKQASQDNIVFFAIGFLPEENLDSILGIIGDYVNIVAKYGFKISIRFHPDDRNDYSEFINKVKYIFVEERDFCLNDLIEQAIFVVATPGSSIINAIHNNRVVYLVSELAYIAENLFYEDAVYIEKYKFDNELKNWIFNERKACLKPYEPISLEALINSSCFV
jgi:hypothetical protein